MWSKLEWQNEKSSSHWDLIHQSLDLESFVLPTVTDLQENFEIVLKWPFNFDPIQVWHIVRSGRKCNGMIKLI